MSKCKTGNQGKRHLAKFNLSRGFCIVFAPTDGAKDHANF